MPPKKKVSPIKKGGKVSLDTKNVEELKKLLKEFDISDDDIRKEFNKKGYVSRDDRIKKLLTLLDGAGKSYTKDNVKIPTPKKKSSKTKSPKTKSPKTKSGKKDAKVIIQKHKSYSFDKKGNLYKEGKVIARIDFTNGGVKNLTASQAKKLGSLAQKKALSDGALAKLDKYVQSYTSKTVKAASQGIEVSEAVKKLFEKASPKKKKASPKKKKSPVKKASPKKKKASPKKKKSPVKKTAARKEMTGKEIMEAMKKYSQFKGKTDYQVKKTIGEKNGKKPNEVKVADLHKVLISLMASSPSKKDHIKVKTPKKASPKKKSTKKASPKKKSPVKKASPVKVKLEDEIASLEEEISHLEKEISKKKKTPEKKRSASLDKEIASLEKEVSSLEKKISKKGKSLKCKNRKKCKLNFCETKTGKCIPKGKDGAPEGFKKGKKIVFDAELGLTGTQKDIDAHRQYWEAKKSSKKGGFEASFDDTRGDESKNNRAPTPNRTFFEEETSVKNGRCGSPDMTSFEGYDKCEPDEACDVLTGNCVKGGLKRGMWSLNTGDRILMGTPEVIEALHKLDDFKNGTIDKNYQSPKKEKTTSQTTTKSYVPPPEKVSSADLKGKQDEIWKYFQTCLNEKMKGK